MRKTNQGIRRAEHSVKAGLTSPVIGAEEGQERQEGTDGNLRGPAGKKTWKEMQSRMPERHLSNNPHRTARTADRDLPSVRPADNRRMNSADSYPYQDKAGGHAAVVARARRTDAHVSREGTADVNAGREIRRTTERTAKERAGAGVNMPTKRTGQGVWNRNGTVPVPRGPIRGEASTGASIRGTTSMAGASAKGTASASGTFLKGTGQIAGTSAKGTAAAASGAATAGASTAAIAVTTAASAAKRVAKRAADRAREALEASIAGKHLSGAGWQKGNREDAAGNKTAGNKNAPGLAAAGFFSAVIILVLFVMMSSLLMLSLALHQKTEEQAKAEGGKQIVAVARQEAAEAEANIGGGKYKTWYGMDDNWCAMFVSWCANECGYIDSGTMPKTASVANMKEWYQQKGQYYAKESGYEPKAGDVILFGNGRSHTGLVVEYDPETKTVTTVEGNTGTSGTTPYHKGSRVKEKKYPLTYNTIAGYGLPEYPADGEESSEISETELKEEEVDDIADTDQ